MDIQELDQICMELKNLKDEKAELKKKTTFLEEKIRGLELQVLTELETNKLDRFNFQDGIVSRTFHVSTKVTNKEDFTNYMKGKGIWDSMASVNSNSLKAYVKEEKTKLEEKGIFTLDIPGIEINEIEKISLRRSK